MKKKKDTDMSLNLKNGCNTHPHNIYLEYLSELGFLGFILLNLIFVYAFIKLLLIVFKNFFKKCR